MILRKFLKPFNLFKVTAFFLLGASFGFLVLVLLLALVVVQIRRQYAHRVYPGVSLGEMAVGGKNANELEEYLVEKGQALAKQKVVFHWEGNGAKSWEVTPQSIGFSLNVPETVEKTLKIGRREGGRENLFELYRLFLFSENVEPVFQVDENKLEETLSVIGSEVDRPPKEALFDFQNGKVVSFQTSQAGRQVKEDETKNLLVMAFSHLLTPSEETLNLDLPVEEIKPKVQTSETNDLGIKEALGEGESFFFDSIPSRVHNIGLAVSYLHGVVIPPGEVFSFSDKVGSISAETGYQQAYVIKDKKTVLEDGGGVCQVSTTLFRAALNSGLPIVERQPHYYRVSFYEQGGYPPGIDATVYPPSPDFKFKNDTSAYLLIQASLDKTKKRLAFTIYGTSDGRTAEVEKPIIHSRTPAPEPTYIDDPTLPSGVVKQRDQAHPGAKVSFKRKVWFADGQLKEEREFWSNYVAWPAVFLRGTMGQ